jgi:hypothetical protein
MGNIVKIGDKATYRGTHGYLATAVITGIEVTENSYDKYGEIVDECDVELIWQDKVCLSLDDGHWCYSSQVERIDHVNRK